MTARLFQRERVSVEQNRVKQDRRKTFFHHEYSQAVEQVASKGCEGSSVFEALTG